MKIHSRLRAGPRLEKEIKGEGGGDENQSGPGMDRLGYQSVGHEEKGYGYENERSPRITECSVGTREVFPGAAEDSAIRRTGVL